MAGPLIVQTIPASDHTPLEGWRHETRPGLQWAEIDEDGNTVILSDEEMAERYADILGLPAR